MRKFLQRILRKPIAKLADKYSSRPNKERVHKALSELHEDIIGRPGKKGEVITFNPPLQRFIIFSDQHKGRKNGSDDFAFAEKNYLAALDYYYQNNYYYINLGDSEELWENTLIDVKKNNVASFEKEKLFLGKKAFIKIFGNHDLDWDNNPLAKFELAKIYGEKMCVYEGAILQTVLKGKGFQVFLTHGHQGDAVSDGNWFSKWFVSNIWAPLQAYLGLNPNTPAYDDGLKTEHNKMMYEWSAKQKNLILITGHTHQPVFESLTHFERLYRQLELAKKANDEKNIKRLQEEIKMKKRAEITIDFTDYKPSYFNSGCCCFSDGDITGIEVADDTIRLIKWEYDNDQIPRRVLMEEVSLEKFLEE